MLTITQSAAPSVLDSLTFESWSKENQEIAVRVVAAMLKEEYDGAYREGYDDGYVVAVKRMAKAKDQIDKKS